MTKFILSDPQELTRRGIEALIASLYAGSAVVQALERRELVSALLADELHRVVILDYTLFDFPDVESLINVSERFPDVQWLLMSDELTNEFVRTVTYRSHSMSVVFKDAPLCIIADALADATGGHRYVCQRATEMLIEQRQSHAGTKLLTPTEIDVLKAIARGRTTKEIAQDRVCSVHTVNTHRKNIFRKLSVNTAHEAVKYAFRAGLVDPSEFYI